MVQSSSGDLRHEDHARPPHPTNPRRPRPPAADRGAAHHGRRRRDHAPPPGDPSINGAGTAVFTAYGPGGMGIYTVTDGVTTTLTTRDDGPFFNLDFYPQINDAGTVVFWAELDGTFNDGIYMAKNGPFFRVQRGKARKRGAG